MASLYKTKQYLFALAKVLVLSITFGYIYYRLQKYASQDFIGLINSIASKGAVIATAILIMIVLTLLNWFFEILKWKTLVSTMQKIDFSAALKQTLAALTVSLATPNRIGDYGAKVLFFEKEKRKKILLFNFFSNAVQLFVTIVFGLFGLIFCLRNYQIPYSKSAVFGISALVISIFVVSYIFKDKELFVKGFSVSKTVGFFQKLSTSTKLKVVLFSFIRYLIFSGMFYFLLLFFGAEIAFPKAMMLIFTTYLLVSFMPSIFIFDVVIRGGVALWLFSFEGVAEFIVLAAVLFMWIFNFVIPSIFGSVYVIRFQPVAQ